MGLDDPVCLCFHVSRRKVLAFLRVERPQRPGQLSECFGAGTGCGWCRPYLERLFEETAHGAAAPEELTTEEYARRRAEYLRTKEAPEAGPRPAGPDR
jgi:NAD(P)H-nitrite reductase large subunit